MLITLFHTAVARVRGNRLLYLNIVKLKQSLKYHVVYYIEVKCGGQYNIFKRSFLIDNYLNSDWFISEYEKMIYANIVMNPWNMNW